MHLLTVSEMKAYRTCARYHHIRYRLGFRPVSEANPLSFGKLIHTGLEVWWNTRELDSTLLAVQPSPGMEYDLYEQVKVECLLEGYHCMYASQELEVVTAEVEFRTCLVNPQTNAASKTFELGGKIDVVAQNRRGIWIVEHKTTSEDISQGSEYWLRLRLDAQVSTYFVGARALGHDVQGCIYDVIKKPALRPSTVALTDESGCKIVLDQSGSRVRTKDGKKFRETGDTAAGYVLQTRPETPEEFRARLREDIASNPEKYYARGEVVRLEDDELDAAADTWATARQIRDAELQGRYPRNPGGCVQWGRTCEFFGVCTRAASLDDPTLFRLVERAHEELSQEVQTEQAEEQKEVA